MPRLAASLLLLALALGGCDTLSGEAFEEQPVVSAVLVAGQPLPPISLTLTAPIDQPFRPEARRIAGATLTVSLLRADGAAEAPYAYRQDVGGLYVPADAEAVVEGGRRYRLEAVVPGFAETVRAETTVPTAFEVVQGPPDTLLYNPANGTGPSVHVTPSVFPGRDQAAYFFSIRALAPDSFFVGPDGRYQRAFLPGRYGLTPFAASIIRDRDVNPADFANGNSPVLNEANYQRNPDGSITLTVPWLGVSYFGPQLFSATALDDALLDFIQSQVIQFVPTTLSPGEIPAVVTNVENGLGVFGAVAQQSVTSFIREP